MAAKKKSGSKRGGKGRWITIVIVLLLVAYLLSPPLALRISFSTSWEAPSWVVKAVEGFYAPLQYAYDHFPPYKKLMDAEMKAVGVQMAD